MTLFHARDMHSMLEGILPSKKYFMAGRLHSNAAGIIGLTCLQSAEGALLIR